AHGDGEVVDLLRGGQGVLNIVPLSGVLEELDAAIVQMERPPVGAVGTPVTAAASGGTARS
ncbi:MAG TPA: hypothetical protein VK386_01910, partial [Acidimicrobiales bacterium]|nr:hypothetical protein [Acidimicrobiales bacterium]